MTDPRTPDVTDEDRRIARDWAESVHSYPDTWTDRLRAAARVILNDVPAPPLPTLADMTPEERAECQGMQADTKKRGRAIITDHDWRDGHADLIDRQGKSFRAAHDTITPRPDLPRFVWPGDKKPEPAPAPALPEGWRLADHKDYGRVMVTNPTPDTNGHVYFVLPDDDLMGYDWHFCRPDALTYLDQEAGQ